MSVSRAIIIGGGLHGMSTAIHLRLKGLQVTLVEKNTTGRHASSVNAGGVRQLRRDVAEIPLAVAALDRWNDLTPLLGHYADLCGFSPAWGRWRWPRTTPICAGSRTAPPKSAPWAGRTRKSSTAPNCAAWCRRWRSIASAA